MMTLFQASLHFQGHSEKYLREEMATKSVGMKIPFLEVIHMTNSRLDSHSVINVIKSIISNPTLCRFFFNWCSLMKGCVIWIFYDISRLSHATLLGSKPQQENVGAFKVWSSCEIFNLLIFWVTMKLSFSDSPIFSAQI